MEETTSVSFKFSLMYVSNCRPVGAAFYFNDVYNCVIVFQSYILSLSLASCIVVILEQLC